VPTIPCRYSITPTSISTTRRAFAACPTAAPGAAGVSQANPSRVRARNTPATATGSPRRRPRSHLTSEPTTSRDRRVVVRHCPSTTSRSCPRITRATNQRRTCHEGPRCWASYGSRGLTSCAATGTSPRPPKRLSPRAGCTAGDIARIDDEGYIYIVDRAKDMIIRGGETSTQSLLKRPSSKFPRSPTAPSWYSTPRDGERWRPSLCCDRDGD